MLHHFVILDFAAVVAEARRDKRTRSEQESRMVEIAFEAPRDLDVEELIQKAPGAELVRITHLNRIVRTADNGDDEAQKSSRAVVQSRQHYVWHFHEVASLVRPVNVVTEFEEDAEDALGQEECETDVL